MSGMFSWNGSRCSNSGIIDIAIHLFIVSWISITYMLVSIVESGVGLSNLWVKSVYLFWLWVSGSGGSSFWLGSWVSIDLKSFTLEKAVSSSSLQFTFTASVGSHWLDEMEFVTLHGDVFSHILVSVHTSGEGVGELSGA